MNRVVCDMLAHPDKAALVSVFMHCELLHAMDVLPMCAELYSSFINGSNAEAFFAEAAEVRGIPESYCSYHKILLGGAYSGVLPSPAMVVNTSLVRDANNLTFRELPNHYHIPQYYVDVPPERSEDAVAYLADELRELAAFLEENTVRRLDNERLHEALVRSRDTSEALRACMRQKRSAWLPGDVTSEMYTAETSGPPPRWRRRSFWTWTAWCASAICKQTMGLSAALKASLEASGFPNGDGCDRRNASDGQTATRLNAFLAMLEETNHDRVHVLRL